MQGQSDSLNSVDAASKERVLTGFVVSDKMQKTGVVVIERKVKHPMYGKYVKKSTRIKFHDEHGVAKVGDKISIKQCRPVSKHKAWALVEVLTSTV